MVFQGFFGGRDRDRLARYGSRGRGDTPEVGVEWLESRALMAAGQVTAAAAPPDPNQLTAADVKTLLERAARATASNDAIVAVVDRQGNVLGVRVEGNVSPAITQSNEKLVFSIDGALAEARTGAFFGSNQAPLTSRTIENISQSTMTQREIQSDPNISDPNSTVAGPGFVAPIGLKGHFPPRVQFTPQVDLFQIEHTNRDSLLHTGPSGDRNNLNQDIPLPARFNANPTFIPPGQTIAAPESYGFVSGLLRTAQARGIGTLPGGIPIFNNGKEVGGIGVFFPGTTGFATEENSTLNDAGFFDPKKRDRAQEAEYIAFVAAGGSKSAGLLFSFNTPQKNAALGLPPLPGADKPALTGFDLPFGRIDLVGITLDIFGGHGLQGPRSLVAAGRTYGLGDINSGINMPVVATPMPQNPFLTIPPTQVANPFRPGKAVPDGWLVTPHDAADGSLTAADVSEIVQRGIFEANQVRAAIRLPLDSTAKMVISVTDKAGNILGLFRMPDATYFSIDVAVAKARNVSYYADPNQLQPIDQVSNLPAGVAMTNRTFRYLAEPRFPEAIDGYPPGPFSILNVDRVRTVGAPLPKSAFQGTVQGHDAFYPQTNFHDPNNIANQNGIVFFPGAVPLYKDVNGSGQKVLVGGLGVSGDGVDQDDDVTFQSAVGFEPPKNVARADEVFVRGVRLPYQKFNRQPHESLTQEKTPPQKILAPKPNGDQNGLGPADVIRIQRANAQFILTGNHPTGPQPVHNQK